MAESPLPKALREASTLGQLVTDACREYADQPALEDSRETLTYRQLGERIGGHAQALGSDSSPVIVVMSNTVDSIARWLAVWRRGRCVIPLDATAPPAIIVRVIERTGASIISLPLEYSFDIRDLGADAPTNIVRLRRSIEPRDSLLVDAAVTFFTSGSTGEPKGVVLGADGLLTKLRMVQEALRYSQGERALGVLKSSFLFFQWDLLLTLSAGGSMRIMERYSAGGFAASLAAEYIHRVALVPTMLRILLERLKDPAVRSSLCERQSPARFIAGGEPLPPHLGKRIHELLPHVGITVIYGLTETSAPDFILDPRDYKEHSHTVGRALRGVEWYVGSPGNRQPGLTGILYLQSKGVLRGYLGRRGLTANVGRDGFFCTHDAVEVQCGGRIRIVGRDGMSVSRGGHKIEPAEVEALFESHPGINGAFVCGVPDAVLGERLHAVVSVATPSIFVEAELRSWLRMRIESYKIPDTIHVTDLLPSGPTGKVDRARLTAWVRKASMS